MNEFNFFKTNQLIFISKDNYCVFAETKKQFESIIDITAEDISNPIQSDASIRYMALYEKFSCAAITTLVFASFAIESHINDYGKRRLGSNYFKSLDKLDPLTKWSVIPRLVNSLEIRRDDANYETAKSIFNYRNDFAHAKSVIHKVESAESLVVIIKSKGEQAQKMFEITEKIPGCINFFNSECIRMDSSDQYFGKSLVW